jgi:hypothetical protein
MQQLRPLSKFDTPHPSMPPFHYSHPHTPHAGMKPALHSPAAAGAVEQQEAAQQRPHPPQVPATAAVLLRPLPATHHLPAHPLHNPAAERGWSGRKLRHSTPGHCKCPPLLPHHSTAAALLCTTCTPAAAQHSGLWEAAPQHPMPPRVTAAAAAPQHCCGTATHPTCTRTPCTALLTAKASCPP